MTPPITTNLLCPSRLLSETTNSYKYLFFWALTKVLNEGSDEGLVVLKLEDLIIRMAELAWVPSVVHKLEFGSSDMMARILAPYAILDSKSALTTRYPGVLGRRLKESYKESELSKLGRYVPFRLLRPFFMDDLLGSKDHDLNRSIVELANRRFSMPNPPLYRFLSEKEIEVHPAWVAYIKGNYVILDGWIKSCWIDYLQARNPNVPSISKKAEHDPHRSSLRAHKAYWNIVASNTEIKCIYTLNPIIPDQYQIDHFVPWSFICHDQPWNLIPSSPEANSMKGDKLPSHE